VKRGLFWRKENGFGEKGLIFAKRGFYFKLSDLRLNSAKPAINNETEKSCQELKERLFLRRKMEKLELHFLSSV